MLPICQICLRTDRKYQELEETLLQWHDDELCDFSVEGVAQFCSECVYLLKKFYNFKKKCVLATKILNKWKNEKVANRTPLNLLYKKIPQSSLGFDSRKNRRIYFYQSHELQTVDITTELNTDLNATSFCDLLIIPDDYSNPLRISRQINEQSSNQCTIVEETKSLINQTVENQPSFNDQYESIKETVKVEDGYSETLTYNYINEDDLKSNNSFDDLSESSQLYINELIKNAELKSENDSSDDEVLIKKKQKIKNVEINWDSDETKECKKKRMRRRKPFNIEALKKLLINRFECNGEVKDEEGNLIEKECIINSLDKMHIYTLNQIKNRLSASSTLTSEALQVLSRAQKKYGDQYASVFTIEHLPTMEDVLNEFNKRKDYEAYIRSDFKCELCYRGFKHQKMLDYHVKVYHDESQPHDCPVCKMRFKSRNALLKHRNGHRAVYKCKLCTLVTNYRTAMVNHYHQHKGMVYPCKICNATFKSKSCLHAHTNYMHQSRHICALCARNFASESGLSQHKIRKHQNEQLPEVGVKSCEQCDIVFASDEVLKKHLAKSHLEKKDNVYTYKKRNYVVPRQKPNFVCRVCKITEHSIGRLMWHFRREHPTVDYELLYADVRRHLCHICGKGYANSTDLNEHKHLHSGVKPYACDKCPKTFHRKINLRNHLERHLPPARECATCGKMFVSAANLNNHMKMHIGVRHYTCELCSKSFLHRSALNAHVRGVHHHVRRQRKTVTQPNT